MTCGNCGHEERHGRRGHGACSHVDLTERGREEAFRLEARLADKAPIVRRIVLETALALPGMTTPCTCKRLRKTRPTPTSDGTDTGGDR